VTRAGRRIAPETMSVDVPFLSTRFEYRLGLIGPRQIAQWAEKSPDVLAEVKRPISMEELIGARSSRNPYLRELARDYAAEIFAS